MIMNETLFQHAKHPLEPLNVNLVIEAEKAVASFNDRLAVLMTEVVSTMWCAYAFFLLAMFGFPGLNATPQAYV